MRLKGSFKNILFSVLFLTISIALAAYIYVGSAKTRKIIKVPVLRDNIKIGQEIKESDIANKEIGQFRIDKKIVRSKEDIVGKYAVREILSGRYIYEDDISRIKPAVKVEEKIQYGAVAVTTDLNKCVGGIPRAGDYVKVKIIKKKLDSSSDIDVIQYEELNKVRILAIKNAYGDFLNNEESSKNGMAGVGSNQIKPATVIFDTKPGQEKRLLEGEYSGEIHLVLLPLDVQEKNIDTAEKSRTNNKPEKQNKDQEDIKENDEGLKDHEKAPENNKIEPEKETKNNTGGFKVN